MTTFKEPIDYDSISRLIDQIPAYNLVEISRFFNMRVGYLRAEYESRANSKNEELESFN